MELFQNAKFESISNLFTMLGLFECMFTMRAMRRLKPDPVPDEMIQKILEAATHAPSGQNTQRWGFLVLTEAEGKQFFGERYKSWFFKHSSRISVPTH